jgi:hypothetical protein
MLTEQQLAAQQRCQHAFQEAVEQRCQDVHQVPQAALENEHLNSYIISILNLCIYYTFPAQQNKASQHEDALYHCIGVRPHCTKSGNQSGGDAIHNHVERK